jgi:hypothetical protein
LNIVLSVLLLPAFDYLLPLVSSEFEVVYPIYALWINVF